jgi:pimeloyl-ACP methyl ester carboxylesterase
MRTSQAPFGADDRDTARTGIPGTAGLAGSFVSVPGGRLWAEQAGQGPAVLFAHAGIADRRMWDDQMTALADRYHVIRYDQRGFGRSDPPARKFSHVAGHQPIRHAWKVFDDTDNRP